MNMNRYIQETPLLDYSNWRIQELVAVRKWNQLEQYERIKSIYNYVRDEILSDKVTITV